VGQLEQKKSNIVSNNVFWYIDYAFATSFAEPNQPHFKFGQGAILGLVIGETAPFSPFLPQFYNASPNFILITPKYHLFSL
jgi:hypothetical protein